MALSTRILLLCMSYLCLSIDIGTKLDILPNHVVPVYYIVRLNLSTIEKGFFHGLCAVDIDINKPTYSISLHALQPQIKPHDFALYKVNATSPEKVIFHEFKHDTMTVYYDKELSPGEYVWNITFTTSLFSDDKDLFETSITNGKESGLLLGSPSQKIGARRIFPCWDQPNFKAKFEIRLKHLNKHVVSSNMAIEWEYASPNETITEFVLTPRISPFFVTIMICNISRIPAKDITLQRRQQVTSYLNYAEIMIRNVILHIESQWNGCRLTRFEKMDHVAFPDLRQEFMRIMGFILYRETALIYDEKLDSIMHKINMARLVGYAFAHQCFNKPENFQPWPRVWLTEGILILLTVEEINKLYPDLQIMDLFVVQIQQESLRLDTDSIIVPLAKSTRINQGSPFPYYIKAPVILRILQHTIGQELFWKIIRRLLNNTKYDTWLTLDDFWETLPVLGYIYDSYLSVQNMLTSWIKLPHYPVLKVLQYNRSHVTVIMDNTLGDMVGIPVTYTTETSPNFNNTGAYYEMWAYRTPSHIRKKSTNFSFPVTSRDWIIVNIQQAGYYRVNYDAIRWKRIIRYLMSHNYTKIHVLNRAQIIDDAFYFLMNNQLPLFTFLKLTKYLQHETEYVAWYPMLKALEQMSGFFLFEESRFLKIYIRNILLSLLESINAFTVKMYEKPNNLSSCLTQEAAKWACVLGHSKCQRTATSILSQHLNSSTRVSPIWKKWTYCNGILFNSSDIWWNVFTLWIKTRDSQLLDYLSCTRNSSIVHDYLQLNMLIRKGNILGYVDYTSGFKKVQRIDHVNSFLFTVVRHAKDDIVLEYILRNFKIIIPSDITWYAALISIVSHVQSDKQLDKIVEFVIDYKTRIRTPTNLKFKFNDQHKLTREVYEVLNKFPNFMIYLPILIVKQAIDIRLFEIENQLNYFRCFVRK